MRIPVPLLLIGALAFGGAASAQLGRAFTDADETRAALTLAREQAREAGLRAGRLEADARQTREAAEKTAQETAALAARIQQSEAGIAAARARIDLTGRERAALERRLAERREPLARLTAGLQKLARRPVALAVLQPGSLRETVYLRAMLETTLPEVRKRTAALRGEIARSRQIEAEARAALAAMRSGERELEDRRTRLAALETRQRLASRSAGGAAAREAERALALAEEARDLDGLVDRLDAAGSLRETLAALPGPVMRPPRPAQSTVLASEAVEAEPTHLPGRDDFQLPVVGRTIAGFGQVSGGGSRSDGVSLAPLGGAQVVSPGAGRIAFAGPFRGFDRIVIVEHPGGFTSLVTGLGRVDVQVGDQVVGGAPLGVAGVGRPVVGFELRRGGVPVNPADFIR